MIRIRRNHFNRSIWIIVGPWAGRLAWGSGNFGQLDTDSAFTRWLRRWWSGWHRWKDQP